MLRQRYPKVGPNVIQCWRLHIVYLRSTSLLEPSISCVTGKENFVTLNVACFASLLFLLFLAEIIYECYCAVRWAGTDAVHILTSFTVFAFFWKSIGTLLRETLPILTWTETSVYLTTTRLPTNVTLIERRVCTDSFLSFLCVFKGCTYETFRAITFFQTKDYSPERQLSLFRHRCSFFRKLVKKKNKCLCETRLVYRALLRQSKKTVTSRARTCLPTDWNCRRVEKKVSSFLFIVFFFFTGERMFIVF